MMNTLYGRTITLVIILAFSITACQSDKKTEFTGDKKPETVESNVDQAAAKNKVLASLRPLISAEKASVIKPAFLRKNLPESAFAYVRIPNIWSFIGSAKGNIFDNALDTKPFYEAISGIRTGASENVIPEISEKKAQALVKLLFNQLTSPIEAIAISGVDPAIPTPNLVITTAANFISVEEIQKLLQTLDELSPVLRISKTIQADGYAELTIAGMNAQLQWNQDQKRLTLLVGVSLSPNNLTDLLKTFLPNTSHPMLVLESSIDESGQGLFVWANPRKLASMANTMGKQQQMAPLAMMGVNTMKNIAFGAGTSNDINRLKYVVEMPVTGFRSYMPIIKTSPTFDLTGKTNALGVFGIPSRADFLSIENTIALMTSPKEMEKYYKGKKKFNEVLGFSIDDIFDFFGQDISIVSDEAGIYAAIRLNDAEKFKATLEKSVEKLNLEYQQKTIENHTYHHLKIPSIYTHYLEEAPKVNSGKDVRLFNRFFSVPSHLYWEQEGDYLIMSNIPQSLIDRHYIAAKTPVNEWLHKQQRIDPNGSLMLISVRNQGTAAMMYRMHLSALNYLADFVGKPIDMFALATPREAKLPTESSYGIKVTSSESQLAFELNYESNPFEILLAGNAYEGVAILGVLSAIAVPAYEDYLVRAELINGYMTAKTRKLELDQFEIEYGRYPNEFEIDDLNLNRKFAKYAVLVEANTGKVTVTFKNKKLYGNRKSLSLLPPKRGKSTEWRCTSKILKKHLPKDCR